MSALALTGDTGGYRVGKLSGRHPTFTELLLPSREDTRKTGTNLTHGSTNREEQSTYPAQDWIVLFTLVKKNEEKGCGALMVRCWIEEHL